MSAPTRSRLPAARAALRAHAVPAFCALAFGVAWTALAVAPWSRAAWLLENLPTVAVVAALALTYRRFRFSDRAYLQGCAFLLLHAVGSHYTYARVPLGEWARATLGLARNPYDRAVHLAFGLLVFRANREAIFRRAPTSPGRELGLTFAVVAWWALFYELLEWWVAIIVNPAAGVSFLATQGDPWDTQQDMAMACLGAALAAGGAWADRRAGVPERGAARGENFEAMPAPPGRPPRAE